MWGNSEFLKKNDRMIFQAFLSNLWWTKFAATQSEKGFGAIESDFSSEAHQKNYRMITAQKREMIAKQ